VNDVEVAVPRLGDDATSEYPVPALSILRSVNLATPLVALTVVVPESVPPAQFDSSATVISFVAVVAVSPSVSRITTVGTGRIGESETPDAGFSENFSVAGEGDVVSWQPLTSREHVNARKAEQRNAEDQARTALSPFVYVASTRRSA